MASNQVVLYRHLSEPQLVIVPVCYANIFIVNSVPGSKEKGRSDAEDNKAVKSFPPSPRRGGVSKSGTAPNGLRHATHLFFFFCQAPMHVRSTVTSVNKLGQTNYSDRVVRHDNSCTKLKQ